MNKETQIAILKNRLNKLQNGGKSTGGVERKIARQIRNLKK